jgi:hypothetical protein
VCTVCGDKQNMMFDGERYGSRVDNVHLRSLGYSHRVRHNGRCWCMETAHGCVEKYQFPQRKQGWLWLSRLSREIRPENRIRIPVVSKMLTQIKVDCDVCDYVDGECRRCLGVQMTIIQL